MMMIRLTEVTIQSFLANTLDFAQRHVSRRRRRSDDGRCAGSFFFFIFKGQGKGDGYRNGAGGGCRLGGLAALGREVQTSHPR